MCDRQIIVLSSYQIDLVPVENPSEEINGMLLQSGRNVDLIVTTRLQARLSLLERFGLLDDLEKLSPQPIPRIDAQIRAFAQNPEVLQQVYRKLATTFKVKALITVGGVFNKELSDNNTYILSSLN